VVAAGTGQTDAEMFYPNKPHPLEASMTGTENPQTKIRVVASVVAGD
jgi:hypothetical protein